MPRNIEIKARVADIESLMTRVIAVADHGPVEIIQDDTFFACEAGRLKLRTFSAGAGEFIFHRRTDQRGPKESFYFRSPTSAPGTLLGALSLAYGQVGSVHKRRTLFLWEGPAFTSTEFTAWEISLNLRWCSRSTKHPQTGWTRRTHSSRNCSGAAPTRRVRVRGPARRGMPHCKVNATACG